MTPTRIIAATVTALTAVSLSSAAYAAVVFTLGNNPEPGEQNILFGSSPSGTTISGSTNQSNTLVLFSNFGQTVTTGGIGQAFIQPTNSSALLNSFTFSVVGQTFGDFIFNPQIGGQPQGGGGVATVTANSSTGLSSFNYTLGNGNNFLTI